MNNRRASDTAVLIARGIVLANADPRLRALVTDESYTLTKRLLKVAGSTGGWFEFCARHRPARALLFALERFSLPGIFLHYLVRKKWIETAADHALRDGCRQLVVLGAGLDTLAWRKTRGSSVACFELDHPATQAVKREAFGGEMNTPRLIPADLARESPASKLAAETGFDPSAPAVFVAEGLLMYFTGDRVAELLRELASIAAPGSRFIFTFMEAIPGRPVAFHNARPEINRWLKTREEPFRWGIAADDVTSFSIQNGWHFIRRTSQEELRAGILRPHGLEKSPLASGESIALIGKPLA